MKVKEGTSTESSDDDGESEKKRLNMHEEDMVVHALMTTYLRIFISESPTIDAHAYPPCPQQTRKEKKNIRPFFYLCFFVSVIFLPSYPNHNIRNVY